MIYLDTSSKSLQVQLAASTSTTQFDVVSCYYDVPARTKADFSEYLGAVHVTTTLNTTHVLAVPPPPFGVTRNVESLFIFNADVSTGANRVLLKLDDAGTRKVIQNKSLNTTQALTYEDGAGFIVS